MIINPFTTIKNENEKIVDHTSEKLNIKELQKYLINNHLEYLKKEDKEILTKIIEKYMVDRYTFIKIETVNKVIQDVFDKMFGYDILQKYIDNEEISDIRVVNYNSIYTKSKGKWKKENESFESEIEFYDYIRYCILKNNSNINFDTPIIVVSDKKYNLRIEAGLPPVNVFSPSIVIRIHRNNKNINLETLFVIDQMLNGEMYKLLTKAVLENKNIVISGKGGSGKTTLLRALINKLPSETSITTNEETMELFIEGKNVIQREILESREESKKITLEKLTRHSLVMSNDTIIIGELKGAEALVFFDSIATGHMGLTTVHSDNAYNTIDRLITLIKRDNKAHTYKEKFINKMLTNTIDYIIFMKDYKINEIVEISYDRGQEEAVIKLLYKYTEIKKGSFKGLYYYTNGVVSI